MDHFQDQSCGVQTEADTLLLAMGDVWCEDQSLYFFGDCFAAVVNLKNRCSLFIFFEDQLNRLGRIFRFNGILEEVSKARSSIDRSA